MIRLSASLGSPAAGAGTELDLEPHVALCRPPRPGSATTRAARSARSNGSLHSMPRSPLARVSSESMRRSVRAVSARTSSQASRRVAVSGFLIVECHLQQGSFDRERGAQFMGGVGHEVPLRPERRFQPREQLVQRLAEPAEFVVAAAGAQPPAQVVGRDVLRGRRDQPDRPGEAGPRAATRARLTAAPAQPGPRRHLCQRPIEYKKRMPDRPWPQRGAGLLDIAVRAHPEQREA